MLIQVILFFTLMYICGILLDWYAKRRKIRKEKKFQANLERLEELGQEILAEEKRLRKQAKKVAKAEKKAAKKLRQSGDMNRQMHWSLPAFKPEDPNSHLTDDHNNRLN